eukprot:scaffold12505_cov55-Phaeocystis_antarctica.AAC.1
MLRLLWAERPNTAVEAHFVRCGQFCWAVRPGRTRCLRGRPLRTVGATSARRRTDRVLAAEVASRAAISAARPRLIGHVVAVSEPELTKTSSLRWSTPTTSCCREAI